MTKDTEKLLEAHEVAEILKLKPSLVFRLVREGQIPYLRIAHRKIRFERSEITKWIEARRIYPVKGLQLPLCKV